MLDLIEREDINNVAGVPTTMFELLDEARRQGRELPIARRRRVGRHARAARARAPHRRAVRVAGGADQRLRADRDLRRGDRQHRRRLREAARQRRHAHLAGDGGPHRRPRRQRGRRPARPARSGCGARRSSPGYFGLPEETAAALVDGWFRTGDVGRLDDEGYLYVVDRLKDVIIRGGENVYAAEVEAVLYEHPDVAEAAIVGIPDERLGEQVAAFVRLRDGSTADADELRRFVADRLAAFKVPAVVEIRADALPRNAAGKVLKRELRDSLGAAHS